MAVHYKRDIPLNPRAVAALYDSAGLKRPTDDIPRMERMLKNVNLIITAWDKDELVGVARSLTDFSHCCYLADLAVKKEYQKKGIGKELIKRTQEAIGEESMLLLLSAPIAMEYYPKVGFEKVQNGFIINRKR